MILKEKWAEIIKDFQENKLPELVEREFDIPKKMPIKRAVSIIGPRRSGKTYTMYQIIKKLPIDKVLYINFEKTYLEGCTNKDLINMLDVFHEIHPDNKNEEIWLFLDEIQNVKNWEVFVRTSIDENINVFISGSSSKLLSKEIATSMRGRTITHTILPFSFREYLLAEGIELKKYYSSSEKSKIINKSEQYLENGGYPETIFYKKEREKILLDIIETTIYRDVIERYKIRNTKLLKLFIKTIINSSAKEFSIHKFYNFIKSMGMKASKNTLYKYMEALNDVFFAFPLRKFSFSYKDMEQSLPKVYVVDNGLLSVNGMNNNTRLLENLVFVELIRRNKTVHYYKSADNKELDFVVLDKKKPKQLIQVAYSLEDFSTKEREIKSLLKSSEELKCNKLLVITWSTESTEKVKGKTIKYIPLWKWLLEK